MKKQADTVIKLSPSCAQIVVEQTERGVVSRKTVTAEVLFKAILGSRYDDGVHPVGFLPEHCFSVTLAGKSMIYYLRFPNLQADVSYYGTEYPAFPLPRLVFSIRYLPESGKVGGVRMAVVQDERLTPDTPMYVYPFSNVYGNHQVCLGNNALPVYKDPARLHTLMRHVLAFPNNDDMFREENNRLGLGYRDLMEHLKNKPPAYYYSNVLLPTGKTLKDFMKEG